MTGETGRVPAQQPLHEALGKTFRLMKAAEDETPEEFLDDAGVKRGERQELALVGKDALGYQGSERGGGSEHRSPRSEAR